MLHAAAVPPNSKRSTQRQSQMRSPLGLLVALIRLCGGDRNNDRWRYSCACRLLAPPARALIMIMSVDVVRTRSRAFESSNSSGFPTHE